jgi:serine/threonine protein phosphatase 1
MTGNRDIIAAGDQGRIRCAPDGQLIYAIGDIHGRADLLDSLLTQITDDAERVPEARQKTLIFLGDYIDRGPDSARLVETLLSGLPAGFDAHFLTGNHEAMLVGFLDETANLTHWVRNGGDATLASYGIELSEDDIDAEHADRLRRLFARALPQAHRKFFDSLELSVVLGDYFFVHAGIRPGLPLDQQDPHDLLWIREEFGCCDEDFGKLVVHGHTSGPKPIIRSNRICIDTHAWSSGRLTALRIYGSGQELLWTSPDEAP